MLRYAALRTVPRAIAPARRAMVIRSFSESNDAAPPAKKATKPAKAAKAPKAEKAPKVEKPKAMRAPSAYNLFYKAIFQQVRSENPDKKVTELGSKVRDKWASISAVERAPYEAQAAARKKEVDAKRAEVLAAKKAAARPVTAYIAFANAKRPEIKAQNPDKTMAQVASLLGSIWKGMSEEQQKPYRDQAKAAMDAWKAKQQAQQSA